ncbi:hypothetical protein TU65_25530 [Bacillus wiedmannii]|uniref:chitobiase/beta-hexosaminidase C-terminal domain-containing protein n=2 Tax=Bacillus wiedmannii TaxID=1890302 RepID=UPI00065B6923|nr:chitobiase/beta-hexosaminidase C-terminal domain-containing protein [Bacillus wiedmannii]KMP90982.1 hypothetical protein TU65_25530 [Bacillus wiedmannii]
MNKRWYTLLIIFILLLSQLSWIPQLQVKAGQTTNSAAIHKLMPKYLVTNFNFDMTAATVTLDKNNFYVAGNFRTGKDLVGVKWETQDNYSHPDLKYPTKPDFSNVTLEYDYTIEGFTNLMDSGLAPSLTIETNSGEVHYVRLWNYVTNRPKESWEIGATRDLGKEIMFPKNRKEGNANGNKGQIKLDFNNLYSGWTPYTYDMKQGKYVPDPNWRKIPVNDIKSIMWSVVPQGYQSSGEGKKLGESKKFKVQFNNWKVSGNTFLMNEPQGLPNHSVRMTDDYDDTYNLTPERVVGDYKKLGYNKLVNFYIGASHYYDKSLTDSGVKMDTEYPFNQGFEEWYRNYAKRLKENNMELIQSISMESVDAPESWWQRTWNNVPGTTGWTPTPHLLSFTNEEVKAFYKKYTLGLAKIASDAGLVPMVQLGEPWWWHKEDLAGKPPCFYDQATKDLFEKENGYPMYEFHASDEDITGHEEMLEWLSDKNGEFSLMLRDTLKKSYSNAKFTVLFFTPSVIDKDRVPLMMSTVNFPKRQWKYPNLDFFMIEDYDYLIDGHMDKHKETLTFAQENLGYPSEKIHYFSGFVLNKEQSHVWTNINEAINDGFNQKLGEVYIWAYAQVIRDGWKTPNLLSANYASGIYGNSIDLKFSSENADKIIYTLDGTEPSSNHGSTYMGAVKINSNTKVKAIALKGDKILNRATLNYTITNQMSLKNLQPVDISENQSSKDFSFTPDKTGVYRFFTMPYKGKEQGTGNELKLYQGDQQLDSNIDSNGPYGEHYAKVEYKLQAGTTYRLNLSNPSGNNTLKTTLMVENDFNGTKQTAETTSWDKIKDHSLTSLYDVDYYKVTLTSLNEQKLNLTNNAATIENENGDIVKTMFPGNASNSFKVTKPGTYYIRLWNNNNMNTDPDLMKKLNQLNKDTNTDTVLEMQRNLQKMKFYFGDLTGFYNSDFYMSLISYKKVLNKWDSGVAISGQLLTEDANIDDRIRYYAKRDVDLGRDAEGGIYETLFAGDLVILQALPVPGESVLMLGLTKIGGSFVLKEIPALSKLGKLTYDKNKRSWLSSGGLEYTQGSAHGNRVKHVLDHTKPNPNKTTHSVFNTGKTNVLELLDQAWLKKGSPLPNDPSAYIIPMGKVVGTEGETAIRLVVQRGTNKVITAYPVKP